MTPTEQKAFDAMREALDTIIQYNRDHAACQYGDAEKAERWACVVKAREALTAANAVQPQAQGEALPLEGSEAADNAIHAILCERQWPSSSMNAARAGWRAARLFANPQATEPAGYKLVPVEPTPAMLYAIQNDCDILPPRGKRIWAAMLAAAPEAKQ